MPIYFFGPLYRALLSGAAGEVKHFEQLPAVLSEPLVITENGTTQGIKSGERSALLQDVDGGRFYRIKGCKPTTQVYGEGHSNPKGGQILSFAEREIQMASELGEIFRREGFEQCYRPVGLFLYDMWFKPPSKRKAERLAASIFEVRGETRLLDWGDMLMPREFWLARYFSRSSQPLVVSGVVPSELFEDVPLEVASVEEKFGIWSGRLLGIMHSNHYTWGRNKNDLSNAHAGNYPMVGEGKGPRPDHVYLGVVDLDSCTKWVTDYETMRGVQTFELQRLCVGPSYWRRGVEKGYKGETPPVIAVEDLDNAVKSMQI